MHHGWFVKRFISDFSCRLLYMTLEAILCSMVCTVCICCIYLALCSVRCGEFGR